MQAMDRTLQQGDGDGEGGRDDKTARKDRSITA